MGACCCKDSPKSEEPVEVTDDSCVILWVGGARGLRNQEWFPGTGNLQCFCVVSVKGQKEALLQTKGQEDKLEPVWNEEKRVETFFPGDSLEYSVFEGEAEAGGDEHPGAAPQLLAKGVLESSDFIEDGFNGELKLTDAEGAETDARLTVRVKVFGKCPEDKPTAFSVSIENDPKKSLGAEFDLLDFTTLHVVKVSAGGLLEGSGLQVGDYITKANTVEGDSMELARELTKKGQLELSVRRPQEFCVAVQKREAKQLWGLEFPKRPQGKSLAVVSVSAGPVEEWNKANPEQEVKAGARVLAVNGEQGKARDLLKKFQAEQKLRVALVRPAPERPRRS